MHRTPHIDTASTPPSSETRTINAGAAVPGSVSRVANQSGPKVAPRVASQTQEPGPVSELYEHTNTRQARLAQMKREQELANTRPSARVIDCKPAGWINGAGVKLYRGHQQLIFQNCGGVICAQVTDTRSNPEPTRYLCFDVSHFTTKPQANNPPAYTCPTCGIDFRSARDLNTHTLFSH